MTSTKIAVISVAAALIVATFAVMEIQRAKAAATELDAQKLEQASLLKKTTATQNYVKGYQEALNNLRRQKTEAAEYAQTPHTNPVEAGKAFLAAHPEVKTMLNDVQKSNIAGMFYRFYQELHLTPGQIAEFEDIMFEYYPMGGTPFDKTIPGFGKITLVNTENKRFDKEFADKMTALLGPEGIDKFNAYISSSLISYSGNMAYNLYYTDTPLTSEQAAHIDQLYYKMTFNQLTQKLSQQQYWDGIMEQAHTFLSEPQMAVLAQMRNEADWARTHADLSQSTATTKKPSASTNNRGAE